MKQVWKRFWPLCVVLLALLIGLSVFLWRKLSPSPTKAVEGYIRASLQYDAKGLLRYASDYQVRALAGNSEMSREALLESLQTAYEQASEFREKGKIKFESSVTERPQKGSERYAELLEEYGYKADAGRVQDFAVVEAKCYVNGKHTRTYTAVAVQCGGKWYYAFNQERDERMSANMKYTEHQNGIYSVELSLPQEGGGEPFGNSFPEKTYRATFSEKSDRTPAAVINYRKRPGGTYLYSNNPEMLAPEDVGQALLRNEHLTGRCFFTYEHSNHTGAPFFLGYQLRNEGETEVTVRVSNIGNQVRGEWLGQREWSDFYGLSFDLPEDYWESDGKTVNPIYVGGDYISYTPRPYTPEVFTVPAGGYVWVLGGTSGDLPFGALSGGTADQAVLQGKCANGAVLFTIEGGSMTGTFWCYTEPSQCDPAKPQQGYVVSRNGKNYAAQYKGMDDSTIGLAEADVSWIFDDRTKAGKLPVVYTVKRDPNYASVTDPYAPLQMQTFTVQGDHWLTSLNPNDNPEAVGSDMVSFQCVTQDGKTVCIDNSHTDGSGNKANTGNWMVQNQTNFTFVNAGERDRTVRLFTRNNGVLAVMIRSANGEVLDAKMLLQPYHFVSLEEVFAGVDKSLLTEKNGHWWFRVADGRPYCDVWDERSLIWEATVPAGGHYRVSVDDLILANSCGGVSRWVEIE